MSVPLGITDPQKEMQTVTIKIGPREKDKRAALQRELQKYRAEGWQVEMRLGDGRNKWLVSLFKWNHPQTCQCGKCPKLQPEKNYAR